jgi:hypothetical protein
MPIYVEPNPDGSFPTLVLATNERHTIVLRTLVLDYRYHDDDPVQKATFSVKFANGYEVSGKLDQRGRARLLGVPAGQAEVRYGPDSRPFEPVKQEENPDYRAQMSSADLDALFEKHGGA